MSASFVVPDDTRRRQREAADPAASAWVSANAGAGKTKVLADRVIRLLLSGAPPSRILCLTFTKAAAAEMTIRVFQTLGRWVALADADLAATLTELTGERPHRDALARARRLFASAVETPGGLKIETIHAFCERILHLVPFEANVPARFAVLDESQTGELLAEARAKVLTQASAGGAMAEALSVLAAYAGGEGLTKLVDEAALNAAIPSVPAERAGALARLRHALGVEAGRGPDEIRAEMLTGGILPAEWPALAAELRAGKPTDGKAASALEAAASGSPETRLAAYRSVFFKDDGDPRKSVATKSVPGPIRERLEAEQARLAGLAEPLAAAETAERTEALYRFAAAVREAAEAQKRRLGALDFADLIAKTLALLERDTAAWVLYRLDRGVDHVLVDEAQDTNPDQWRILRHLTAEFTAGAGRPVQSPRTLFAVGDPKQSIYSFQGADPRWFEESRRHWSRRTREAELGFNDVRLDLSFRSAPAILSAVDDTFRVGAHFRGLSFDATATGTSHASARPAAPGLVEIWPTVTRTETEGEPDAWALPVDQPEPDAPAVVLANTVAQAVTCWTTAGDPETGRVWRPGEILILVRSRGPAFFAVIRALKAKGVPIAGADRFDIGDHIAVADLVAAGSAALLPENDLALAAALKSPLVGLTDEDLIRIAADRPGDMPLASALARAAATGDARAAEATAALSGWRDGAARHSAFGFYLDLLGPGGGRRRLIARLGPEAGDAIDAFLSYAHAAEIGPEAPSLTGFLARFESASHTIKRDFDAVGDEVKVMTVHGAKGLEASLVVVIDGCETSGREPVLVPVDVGLDDPVPVWSPGQKSDCAAVAAARAAAKDRRMEEHNRLLYVAMTRARDRLVIAPFVGRGDEPEAAWCAMIRRGFLEGVRPLVRTEMPYGPVDLWRDGTAKAAPPAIEAEEDLPHALPDWLTAPVDPDREPAPPIRPSGALGAADRPATSHRIAGTRREARRNGTLVHAAVEYLAGVALPDRSARAAAFLSARAPRLDPNARARLAADALAILDHPALTELFGPGSRGEVAIAGTIRLPDGTMKAVSGQIDRLAVTASAVLVADFKTGGRRPGAPVPAPYLAQLALYLSLLRAIHPDKTIRTMLVFTAGPEVVTPDDAEIDGALAAIVGSA